jgi:hypothetical protein
MRSLLMAAPGSERSATSPDRQDFRAGMVCESRRDKPSLFARLRASNWFDLGLLVIFFLVSLWVLYLNLHEAHALHLVWAGTFNTNPTDQLQYLAWIRDASHHLLVSDMFVTGPTSHDYLNPLIAAAGGLAALGVAPHYALLLFQPIAVILLFLAVRGYTRRALGSAWKYRAALMLALFSGIPGHVVVDVWIPFLAWGYVPATVGLAAMTGALVCYDYAARQRCPIWVPALLGMLAAWLHPWQGEELALIILLTEAGRSVSTLAGSAAATVGARSVNSRRLALAACTVIATSAPLVYVWLLDRLDPIWHLANLAAARATIRPPGLLLIACLPLLIFSPLAYFRRPTTLTSASVRAWPIAALIVCILTYLGIGEDPWHALSGVTIPLAVLSVEGVGGLLRYRARVLPVLGTLAVLLATVPVTIRMLHWASADSHYRNDLINPGEADALAYLAKQPEVGAVLTTGKLGAIVPEATDRSTYVGNYAWSVPGPGARSARAAWLFYRHKHLDTHTATRFVSATGVRFVLSPCAARADVKRALKPILTATRHFGCASVYRIADNRDG